MMQRFLTMLVGLTLALTLTACGTQPVEEINGARAAVDAAASAGAAKYLPQDYQRLSSQLAAAMTEVQVQDDKLFKNFDQVKDQLVKIKADAETLRAKVVALKRPLLEQARADLTAAAAAVKEAKELLAGMPLGKDVAADLSLFREDLARLDAALLEVQPRIDRGEFAEASGQAAAAQAEAVAISAEISAAIAKKNRRPASR